MKIWATLSIHSYFKKEFFLTAFYKKAVFAWLLIKYRYKILAFFNMNFSYYKDTIMSCEAGSEKKITLSALVPYIKNDQMCLFYLRQLIIFTELSRKGYELKAIVINEASIALRHKDYALAAEKIKQINLEWILYHEEVAWKNEKKVLVSLLKCFIDFLHRTDFLSKKTFDWSNKKEFFWTAFYKKAVFACVFFCNVYIYL